METLGKLYVQELWDRANAIVGHAETLLDLEVPPDDEWGFGYQEEVVLVAERVIMDAARIGRLLTVPTTKDWRESERQFAIHCERARLLGKILEGLDIEAFDVVGLRNSLEHFDARLDRMLEQVESDERRQRLLVVSGLHASELEAFTMMLQEGDELRPLRVYLTRAQRFISFGDATDIGPLREAAHAIIVRLGEYNPERYSEPGKSVGLGLVVGSNASDE